MLEDFRYFLRGYSDFLIAKDVIGFIGLEHYVFKFGNGYGVSVCLYDNFMQKEVLVRVLVFTARYDLYDGFSDEDVVLDVGKLDRLFRKVSCYRPKVWKCK